MPMTNRIIRPGAVLRALLFLVLGHGTLFGQGAFELKPGREAVIGGAGVAFYGFALFQEHRNTGLALPVLDRSRILSIDRIAIDQWSIPAHRASNVLFGVAVAASLTTAIIGEKGERPLVPIVIIAEAGLFSAGLTNTVKELVRRPRPYLHGMNAPPEATRTSNDYNSFWSGHTANTAAITFTCANMVQRSDASSGVKTATWIGAAVAPAAMGYLRARAGRHFPTDVLTGYAVGALVGCAVPYFHRSIR